MGALNQHVVQPVVQPITANIAQGAQAFGQAVAHGLGVGGAAAPAVDNPGLYAPLLGGGEAGMAAAAGAMEGAEIGAFGGPMGMAAGAGIGLAAAAAAAASSSWYNPANPGDPNTSTASSSHQAPVLVHGGDAWHNPASPSLSPGAQAVINGTGHHIPAPPPKRGAAFFGLDTSDGFSADDENIPTPAPRGTRRPAAASTAADRGKKGKVLHDRKWEGKD